MKDARGHGSNSRAGLMQGIPAAGLSYETLKLIISNPQAAAAVAARGMNVPSAADAENVLRSRYGYSDDEINGLKGFGDKQAAGALAQGHPKSAPVPIHPGAAGLQSIHDTVMANLPKGVSVTHTVRPIRK